MSFGTPRTTGIAFGTTATPTFGSPATQFGTGLSFGTPQQQQQSSGITFGTPTNTQPTLNFGAPSTPQTTQQTGLNFGTPTTTPGGLTFGSATPSFGQTTLNFGAASQPQATGLNFGTPASATLSFGTPASTAPAFGASATSSAFGSPASTAPTFGASSSTAPAFGAPSSTTPAFGAPSSTAPTFGASSSTAPAFGVPSSTAPTFGASSSTAPAFGVPSSTAPTFGASSSTAPAFGAPSSTAPTFGASSSTAPAFGAPSSTTPAFGAPSSTAPTFGASSSTAPTFGAPVSTATTSFGLGTPLFGTPTTSAATPSFGASTSFGVGSSLFSTPTTSAAPSFGTQPAPSFGTLGAVATTSTSTTTFSTPGTLQFGASTTSTFSLPAATTTASTTTTATTAAGTTSTAASTTALSFGLSTTTTTSKPLGLFGTTPAATTATTATLGFGTTTTSQTTGFGLGSSSGLFSLSGKPFGALGSSTTAPTTTTTATTPSVGLGGVDPSQNKLGLAGGGSTRTDIKPVKEIQVPNEIIETVDSFKNFLKTQKNLSSDVARGSTEPLNKVHEETETLKQTLGSLQNGIQRSTGLVVKLKSDTAKCLQNAEMAQRTHETPPGLQYDNTAPLKFFQDLVSNFEHEMKVFKVEINNTEKHLHSLMQPMPLSSQELSLAMRRLHDSFVALAGRLQSVHNSVEAEKNQYLLVRKNYQKDGSNIFEEEAKKSVLANTKIKTSFKASAGPTPFSALGGQHGFGLLSSSTFSKPTLPSGWSGGQTPHQQLQMPQFQQTTPQFQPSPFSTPNLSNALFSGMNTSTLTPPQPIENQNFQLQKPPLGNKRGKR